MNMMMMMMMMLMIPIMMLTISLFFKIRKKDEVKIRPTPCSINMKTRNQLWQHWTVARLIVLNGTKMLNVSISGVGL